MIKRIALTVIAALALGLAASAATYAVSEQTSKSAGVASMETMRVCALFESLGEQTAYLLNGNTVPTAEDGELYEDTIYRIATYAGSEAPLAKADLDLLVDSFYNFAHAGGESITKKEIREDLGRFSTLGAAVGYLTQAMMEGLSEEESQPSATGVESIETLRVAELFYTLGDLSAYLLDAGNTPTQEDMETYVDTIARISTYSDSQIPLTVADVDLLVDSFCYFANAGGSPLAREDARNDISRFPTLGGFITYISEALMSGL